MNTENLIKKIAKDKIANDEKVRFMLSEVHEILREHKKEVIAEFKNDLMKVANDIDDEYRKYTTDNCYATELIHNFLKKI